MTVRIIIGDARERLKELPDASVQCCVTSPPYFGLRDYGTATWEGGDPACDHKADRQPRGERARSGLTGSTDYVSAQEPAFRADCGKCGAKRTDSQIGLEPTPDAYVAEMVAVFRDVRRVLRDDGCVFLNLGDSYAGGGIGGGEAKGNINGSSNRERQGSGRSTVKPPSLKPKDLIGIPWRVAFALQADGWWLRSEIIWHKPNPMPESVTDRPTKAHEYVFLLSKQARYFWYADAIAEPATERETFWRAERYIEGSGRNDGGRHNSAPCATRNKRSVWTIATQSFSGSHFATMPPELAETCIKAGSSERGQCPHCGAPWARQLSKEPMVLARSDRIHALGRTRSSGTMVKPPRSETTGWAPTCSCPLHKPVPQVVLDPFGGAGTTALAADRLQRDAIIIELNPAYAAMARERINGEAGLFAPAAE